jgi:3-oxoacyl-[acyl-carrier protein] reductase
MAERTAVITGAGTGIGAACARALSASCDRLVLVGRRLEKLQEVAATLPGEVHVRSCDLTDPSAVQQFAEWTRAALGTVDVIVSNAGSVQPPLGDSLQTLADAWASTYLANTISAVMMIEALAPMLPRPGGRIVIVGSAAARSGNGSPAYAAAKGALQTYAISLMRTLGPHGITANVVAPGYTDGTELVAGRISPERKERLLRGISVGRPAEVDEIAHIIASLAAPGAGFINGETVTVDGGPVVSG